MIESIKYFLLVPIYKLQEYGILGRDLVFEIYGKKPD